MLVTLFAHVNRLARRALPLLAACLLAPGLALAGEPALRELELADYRAYLNEDHPVRQGMRRFAHLVEAAGGGLRPRVRSDAVPGTPAQQLAALRSGAAGAPALMLVAGSGLGTAAPAFALLDLPFLVRDAVHADALLDGPFGDALLARLPQGTGQDAGQGLVGLAWWENGFRHFTTAGAALRRAADLQGLKLRVVGEPVFIEGARAMGADPVPLPFGELHAALQSRRVDAQDNFLSQILAGRLHDVQSALTFTHHSYSPLVLVANAAAWRGLSPAQQRILRTAALEAGQFQRRAAREAERQARAQLAASGLALHDMDGTELARLRAMTAPLRTRYFSLHGQDLWRRYQEQDGAR